MANESIQVHSLAELLEIPEDTKSLWVKPLDSLEMWAAIQRFSQLEELVVAYAKDIPDLSGLQALPHLHTFRLLSNDRLERGLSSFPLSLRVLELQSVYDVLPEEYASLQRLHHLEELTLQLCNLEDDGIQALGHLTHLKFLDLSSNSDFTGTHLAALGNLEHLETLILKSTEIDDTALQGLLACQRLKHLDLSSCNQITQAGLVHLHKMQHLEDLRVDFWNNYHIGVPAILALFDALPHALTRYELSYETTDGSEHLTIADQQENVSFTLHIHPE